MGVFVIRMILYKASITEVRTAFIEDLNGLPLPVKVEHSTKWVEKLRPPYWAVFF